MFVQKVIDPVLMLPRRVKRLIALTMDAGLCVLATWVAFYLRLGEWVPLSEGGWPAAVASLVIALPIFVVSGLYRAVFRYVSWDALMAIVQAVITYGILYAAVCTVFGIQNVPRTIGILQPILLLIGVGSTRALGRYWLGGRYRERLRHDQRKRVMIYGAGAAGRQLAAALTASHGSKVVGFLDHDRGLRGSVLCGVPVWEPAKMQELVRKLDVTEILLAIPSASRRRRNEILSQIRALGVGVRTLPALIDVAHGKITVSDLRPLEIDDLLGREAVAPNRKLLNQNIRDRIVMVTGAGGSIGSELCRQILQMQPKRLILIEASEFALYSIHSELLKMVAALDSAPDLLPLLASVCDETRMQRIFAAYRPEVVYHAAAYKHVPLVEHNIVEGVRNNVIGTWTCARLARDFGVSSFVLVSTDKAVRPTNVMGASKRLAETVLQALAAEGTTTCYSMVRFGNVLGSSGSVVPLFRQQISAGGPVTVTHRDITRYFMTIPEATELVLQAGAMAKGGEVFVLDMGEPVKVVDLARRMIELSGLRVRDDQNQDGDIEVTFTGLRPGEKLYEELLIGNNPRVTDHPRILMACEQFMPMAELNAGLLDLQDALNRQDAAIVRASLAELVPEYSPAASLVDWLHSVPLRNVTTLTAV